MTDGLIYSIIIPVIPFRLESLGYEHVSSLTGYLILANVGRSFGLTILKFSCISAIEVRCFSYL